MGGKLKQDETMSAVVVDGVLSRVQRVASAVFIPVSLRSCH